MRPSEPQRARLVDVIRNPEITKKIRTPLWPFLHQKAHTTSGADRKRMLSCKRTRICTCSTTTSTIESPRSASMYGLRRTLIALSARPVTEGTGRLGLLGPLLPTLAPSRERVRFGELALLPHANDEISVSPDLFVQCGVVLGLQVRTRAHWPAVVRHGGQRDRSVSYSPEGVELLGQV